MEFNLNEFGIEYSKSNRAECQEGCKNRIMKGDIRVWKVFRETEKERELSWTDQGGLRRYHHLSCFASIRGYYNFYVSGDQLTGFQQLSEEDQTTVRNVLRSVL